MLRLLALGLIIGYGVLFVSLPVTAEEQGGQAGPGVVMPQGGTTAAQHDPVTEFVSGVTPQFFTSYTLNGGYVAAGRAMRNKGFGVITISTIPAGSRVEAAFLYWATLNFSATAAMANGKINGQAITGTRFAGSIGPCWGPSNAAHAYRANVTHRMTLTGNGTYNLTGFASGRTDGSNPWVTSTIPPLCEGATLVIIYRNAASPVRTIVLYEGCKYFEGKDGFSFPVAGFVADPVTSASLTVFGADGQISGTSVTIATPDVNKESLAFNGGVIAGPTTTSPWNGASGLPSPRLWDTHTYNVTSRVPLGAKRVTVANVAYSTSKVVDCMNWIGVVFSVTAKDEDRDGLVDSWEQNGYDHDGNGTVDVNLPAMGANRRKKDVFVEIDYMVGAHTHKPIQAGINLIVNSFAAAPVANPNGTTGIKLHVDTGNLGGGNALAHADNIGVWAGFDARKAANFAANRRPIFHYCIFAHNMTGFGSTSGISKGINGRDFIVSLGGWTNQIGTTQEQAGTFMHEFGHNIGLRHGGNNHANYKPNFLSVMNYFFQTRGLRFNSADGRFDYSRTVNRTLIESALNEALGIGGLASYGTRFTSPGCIQRVVNNASANVNWNWILPANQNPVSVNIDNCVAGLVTHVGFNDWPNLVLNGRSLGDSNPDAFIGTMPSPAQFVEGVGLKELTPEEDSRIPLFPPSRVSVETDELGISQLTWRPVGLEIITHYRVYLNGENGVHKLIGSVPADPQMELTAQGVYTFSPDSGVEGAKYGVGAVDHYGNESEVAALQ